MATHEIPPDSPERIALIADALGIPADAPMSDWSLETHGESGMLTVTLKRALDIESVNRIINAR